MGIAAPPLFERALRSTHPTFFADGRVSGIRARRHCERSEAIQKSLRTGSLDCFGAKTRLAMTNERALVANLPDGRISYRRRAQIARRVILSHAATLRCRANHLHISAHPASARGAYRDRHDTRGGMRWTWRHAAEFDFADERAVADGEIVWSWPPGAEVKSAMRRARGRRGQECRSPGRSRISVKTIARGRPVIGCTCGSAACFFVARGPWVSVDTRPSLRPLMIGGL